MVTRKKSIDRVREICLALPEATERLSHGEPTWFAGTKVFASWEDHHHGDPVVGLWVKGAGGLQEILVGAQPSRYYRPKYVGHKGWIGVNMEGAIDWPQGRRPHPRQLPHDGAEEARRAGVAASCQHSDAEDIRQAAVVPG
ncbi:MAG: MmcQ/YjbR family DNA-binding protein [Dehalococcoidia bacterium]